MHICIKWWPPGSNPRAEDSLNSELCFFSTEGHYYYNKHETRIVETKAVVLLLRNLDSSMNVENPSFQMNESTDIEASTELRKAWQHWYASTHNACVTCLYSRQLRSTRGRAISAICHSSYPPPLHLVWNILAYDPTRSNVAPVA